MYIKINNLHELRANKGVKIKDIKKIISKQTYYSMLSGKNTRESSRKKLADFYQISLKEFEKLLKNTIK